MPIIRPRLNDHFNLPFTQDEVDFAIPLLDEDIPLFVDPFLLWKSPSLQDNALHTAIVNSFNHIGRLAIKGHDNEAKQLLISISECNEVGLGNSKSRIGKPIGIKTAEEILNLFHTLPEISTSGFIHFEVIQLFIEKIAKDRISDMACSLIKSFLIDFTIDQAEKHNIPLKDHKISTLYDYKTNKVLSENVQLPYEPINGSPIIFVPKRWLRHLPWINLEDYSKEITIDPLKFPDRVSLLNFNRHNYDIVQTYIANKERVQSDCKNDPLFKPIPVISARRKLGTILKLPTGNLDNVDKKYEDAVSQLMASLLYPQLDFADAQSRTASGVHIRDLIFYNNRSMDFLKDIYDEYNCRQIVMELKNVHQLEREHINQLTRYMKEQFGNFGIIVTRNRPPRRVHNNTIDLWSGQRKCILILFDEDLKLMGELYTSKQRLPIEVIKKKYIEFTRDCPA